MGYTISEITYDALVDQARDLFEDHRNELATNKALMEVNPDHEVYQSLERASKLLVVVAHDDAGTLCGYAVGILGPHPHYSALLCLENDVVYLDPGHRGQGLGWTLMQESERRGALRGARFAQWHAKPGTALDKLLQANEAYKVQDIIHSREIGQ